MQLLTDEGLDQHIWDSGLLARPDHHFLQSWAWGEFQKAIGNDVWRLAVEDNGELLVQLLVIKQSLGLNQTILYSPRGQLVTKHLSAQAVDQAAQLILTRVKRIAQEINSVFFRIDPPTPDDDITSISFYKSLGFVLNPNKPIQPQHNRILDLHKGVDAALAQAKSKTRYNISIARREPTKLLAEWEVGEDEIQSFLDLTHQTANRQGFATHSDRYYRTQIEVLQKAGMLDLITAHAFTDIDSNPVDESIVAAILVVYFGNTATYIHGSSDQRYRSLMAPYLLHYQALRLAKERGMNYYDLGGVHPDSSHKWAGITRFKEGFGGTTIKYVGTLELPLNALLYRMYRLLDLIR